MAVVLHGGFRHSRPPEGDDFHLSGRYRDRGITEHKSGDRHSAPAVCFCVEWQSGIIRWMKVPGRLLSRLLW